MGAENGNLGKTAHQLFGKILGMGGGETEPLQAVNAGHRAQEFGKTLALRGVATFLAVGIDILADEGDLLDPLAHKMGRLGQNIAKTPADLAAPGIGHHAVGAEIIAPLHDGDKPFMRRAVCQVGEKRGDDKIGGKIRGHLGLFSPGENAATREGRV